MNLFRRSKDQNSSKTPNEGPPKDEIFEEEKDAKSSMTDKLTSYTKTYLKQAQSWTAKEASEARKELQRAAGLGEKPNVIPEGEALVSGEPRTVELGWVSAIRPRLTQSVNADTPSVASCSRRDREMVR